LKKFSADENGFNFRKQTCRQRLMQKLSIPSSPQIGVGRGNKHIERPTMKIETSDKKQSMILKRFKVSPKRFKVHWVCRMQQMPMATGGLSIKTILSK
jgi:hypothetical protein